MSKRFEVEVVCRQRALYTVDAPDAGTAERLASERWQRSDPSDVRGVDWCELTSVRVSEAPDESRRAQDEEVVLRFIRERERLLMRLGGDELTASINDSISAAQTAADLGWSHHVGSAEGSVDTIRAARALERLCSQRRLVCFERTRIRSGERGHIRLYSTPEYLERLASAVDAPQRQTGR